MINDLANSLIPVFACMVLGYFAGLRKIVDNKDVKSLIAFVMNFALPCSLFVTIARAPRALLWGQSKVAAVLAMVYILIFALSYLITQKIGRESSANSAVLALILGFPNAAAVGIPLLLAVYGPRSGIAVAVAIAIGSVTISPVTLAILESSVDTSHTVSTVMRVRTSLLKAVKKPVVWAPVLGVIAVATNVQLPSYVDKSLTLLGSATAGTALFLTGLIVSAQRFKLSLGVTWSVIAKNILQPALCLALAHFVNLPLDQTRYVVLICAIPCGFFGIVFGKNFNTTPPIASSSLIASYIVGIFSLAGWIVMLNHLH